VGATGIASLSVRAAGMVVEIGAGLEANLQQEKTT
jgi:hypothetical protein